MSHVEEDGRVMDHLRERLVQAENKIQQLTEYNSNKDTTIRQLRQVNYLSFSRIESSIFKSMAVSNGQWGNNCKVD